MGIIKGVFDFGHSPLAPLPKNKNKKLINE